MNNVKKIRNIIIACAVILIILIIAINVLKKDENKNIIQNNDDTAYFYQEDISTKDYYEYNEFNYINISTEMLLATYFNDYIDKCINNKEEAYELLNEKYRVEKFENYENFAQYIDSKRIEFSTARIEKYEINNYEDHKEYILQDQYGKVYIFNVKAVMEYSVVLDNYTIATDSFLEKYNSSDSEEKAALNLNRFLQAIEDGDYKYAYKKLPDAFKNNYFKTQEEFITYISQNQINIESIETAKIENQSGIYICTLKILNENGEYTERTFMAQLIGDTDYMISFTV